MLLPFYSFLLFFNIFTFKIKFILRIKIWDYYFLQVSETAPNVNLTFYF